MKLIDRIGRHGTIVFVAQCGFGTKYTDAWTEADRLAGRKRDTRYCNMVRGHGGEHDHVPDDDPRSYESAARMLRR